MDRKYILVEFCVKIFTYLILCANYFGKSHVSENWPKIAQKSPKNAQNLKKKPKKPLKKPEILKKPKSPKMPEFFWVIQFRIVQNELWCKWAFFFIEAVKKSPGIKIISLLIRVPKSLQVINRQKNLYEGEKCFITLKTAIRKRG